MIGDLFKSKKFIASLIGLIVTIAAHFGLELDSTAIMTVVSPILAYIVGQGMADYGKEKAKIENEPKLKIAEAFMKDDSKKEGLE